MLGKEGQVEATVGTMEDQNPDRSPHLSKPRGILPLTSYNDSHRFFSWPCTVAYQSSVASHLKSAVAE